MKKIGLFTVAILLAAMLATGCSKSESDGDSNIKEKMENQQLINSIRQHIVGTWVHDGDCNKVYSLATPVNEIILKDELTFEEASEKDTFTFGADGKPELYRAIGEGMTFDGTWSIISDVINLDNEDLLPPYGIRIVYDYNENVLYAHSRAKFHRILFSGDFKLLYLYENQTKVLRYRME